MPFQEHPEGAEARLRRRIERLRNDRLSGSSLIADRTLAALAACARGAWQPGSSRLLRSQARALARTHPAMALPEAVANALDRALSEVRTLPLNERGRKVAAALQDTRRLFAQARTEVAERAAQELTGYLPFLLLSYSGSVVAACTAMRRQRRVVPVVVCESRPKREGRILARRLADAGCRVTLIIDAAMGKWITQCGAVLLGCDRADRNGFVNKIGSQALSLLAENAGRPVYVLVDRFRISERTVGPADLPLYDPADLISGRDRRITVDNPYFEHTRWRAVHRVVTEDGIIAAPDFAA
ncbi:MAG TPA: hypothetical protein VM118_13100 [Acidobacteriota bacterium]|nr:hypothetical protein [Acidobacteriota bacterium]